MLADVTDSLAGVAVANRTARKRGPREAVPNDWPTPASAAGEWRDDMATKMVKRVARSGDTQPPEYATIYGVWDRDASDWIREFSAEHAAPAILAFASEMLAQRRAASYFGYRTYAAAVKDGWCEVVPLAGMDRNTK